MNRRTFIKTTVAASLASSLSFRSFALAKNNPYRHNIGIQLYTLRNQLNEDVAATIRAVAEAGYRQVELYGFSDATSNASLVNPMIHAAKENGLAVNSTHFDWESLTNPTASTSPAFDAILEQANYHGLSHLVVPYLHAHERGSLEDYQRLADVFNAAADKAQAAGVQLAYHNHNFEFTPQENGKTGYEVFTESFSDKMKFEIDVFWVKIAGVEPVQLMRQLSGRVSQLHLKDLMSGMQLPLYETGVPNEAFKELGNGMIPMEPIIEAAQYVGVDHCHVEQDQSPHPLLSIQQSIAYLSSL